MISVATFLRLVVQTVIIEVNVDKVKFKYNIQLLRNTKHQQKLDTMFVTAIIITQKIPIICLI